MIRLLFLFAVLLPTEATELKLTSFELIDQFGHTHRVSFPGNRPVLLTIADHKGADAMNPWIAALKSRYGSNVTYVAIADTRGTPAPMRPFVKAQFRKKYARPVLLDWKGEISLRLSAKPNVPNIYYFAPDGHLKIHKNELYSRSGLSDLPQLPKIAQTTANN